MQLLAKVLNHEIDLIVSHDLLFLLPFCYQLGSTHKNRAVRATVEDSITSLKIGLVEQQFCTARIALGPKTHRRLSAPTSLCTEKSALRLSREISVALDQSSTRDQRIEPRDGR